MAKIGAIFKRRKAIRNIRKITRTMELIATSRFRRALDRAVKAEAYTRKIAELAADLSASATDLTHPLLQKRDEIKNSILLVISSNRGLCGGYNASIIRDAHTALSRARSENVNVRLEISGKRAIAYFRYQGVPAAATYTQFEDKPRFDEVEVLANQYLAAYIAGKIDRVEVAYMKFLNAARQTPVVETLLPLSSLSVETRKPAPAGEAAAPAAQGKVAYEFLPEAGEILEELVPTALKVRLFKMFLDAAVSEQIARRVAMKAATENAGDLIKDITRVYNRTRQANITKEISELIAGAEALK